MAESVGTVHLSISADLKTLESRLKQQLGAMAPKLGREFSDKFSDSFSRNLSPSMVSAVRGAFNKAQRSLTNLHVKVVADLDLGATQAQLDKLGSESLTVTVNVDADTRGAKAKLKAFRAEEDGKSVNQNVDVNTKKAKFGLKELSSGISDISGKIPLIGALGVASMSTLIPVAVAATGAVLALGTAAAGAGASLAVAGLAFSGVGDALTAMDAAQRKSGESATQYAAAANKLKDALAGLSPAGQSFAKFLYGLKGQLDQLRGAAQAALLPPLEKAIKILLPYFPQVKAFVSSVGTAMGDVAVKIARSLTGPEWKAFFSAVRNEAPNAIRTLGALATSIGRTIAKVFTAAAPYAQPLLDGIKGFFDQINQKAAPGKLKAMFDGLLPTLSAAWNVVKSIGNVLKSVVTGGTGTSGGAADTLNRLADAINRLATYLNQHPEVIARLGQIAVGMLALKASSPAISTIGALGQALSGFASLISKVVWPALAFLLTPALEALGGVLAAITAPVWIVIGVIALLVGALVLAYFKVQWFHDAVNTVVHSIGAFFVWLWQNAVSPALHAIGAVFQWLYNYVIKPVWSLIWTAIKISWALIEVIFGTIEIAVKILGAAWDWLYHHAVKPVWDAIAGYISDKWNKSIRPVLNAIGDYMRTAVAPKLKTAIGIIRDIWNGLMETFKAPIRFLIQTVLDDGLFAAYNWVAKKFSIKPDDVHVDVPAVLQPTKRATGGGIAGPGSGTSDSIPALLSNGEHVWTAREVQAAGGHGAVEAIRSAVLNGAMPRYASGGGVINWIKNAGSAIGSGANWAWNKTISAAEMAKNFVTDPLGTLKRIATAALSRVPGGRDGLLSKVVSGVADKTVSGVAAFAKSLLGFGGGGGGGAPAGAGVERWRPMVIRALATQGLSPGLADKVLRQINTESGGNANAIQQVHDVNWPNNRAQGLMQVIPPTFRAWHWPGTSWDEFDGWANIMAGLNYAKHTYGPTLSALGQGHGYDSGGWLMPGTQLVHNNTGKPEAVFSPSQWRALEANLGGGTDGGDFSKTTHIDVTTFGDPNAIASAIAAEQGRADLLAAISL